jgi:GxxExxY protein
MKDTKRDPQIYSIIGAAMEVHSQLGSGFLEAVYQEALDLELEQRKIPFKGEVQLRITYKSEQLESNYRADFICFDSVIVELKALSGLSGVEEAQVINYLKASGFQVALLINFGAVKLEYKSLIYSHKNQPRHIKE